jgi:hypothetical protein
VSLKTVLRNRNMVPFLFEISVFYLK